MPWHVAKSDSCPTDEPWAVIKDADGAVVGCHASKQEAQDQITALYANEDSRMNKRPKTHLREERTYTVELEVRAEGGQARIVGHPLRYDVWSQDLGGFKERIMPGAVTKTLAESDIRALFNHDPNIVLGRNKSGTLSLTDQAQGLRMEATPPDTQTIRDLVLEPMRRGDIDQMSFAFRAIKDRWNDGYTERDLVEMRLFDVSVVTFPAYTQTDAAVRSTMGLIDGIGIDWPALTACLTRAERGLPIMDADVDLLTGSIAVLRSYIPSEPEPSTPHEPQAGRAVVHLRRLLDIRERELSLTA